MTTYTAVNSADASARPAQIGPVIDTTKLILVATVQTRVNIPRSAELTGWVAEMIAITIATERSAGATRTA
jgi:hypothetical protein